MHLRLGPGVVHPKHPLDRVTDQLRVVLLHPLAHHQVRRLAQPSVVRQDEAALQAIDVAGQALGRGVTRIQRHRGGPAGGRPGADGKVDPLQPDARRQTHGGGVATDHHAVGDQLGHHVVARFGDDVGGELADLTAVDQRRYRRVGLQLGEQFLRAATAGGEGGQRQHQPHRHRIEVGVDKPAARHITGGADDLDVGSVATPHPEAILDHRAGKAHHLLDTHREVGRLAVRVHARFLGQEGVDPVGGDHDVGVQVAVGAVGAHADHLAPARRGTRTRSAPAAGAGRPGTARPVRPTGLIGRTVRVVALEDQAGGGGRAGQLCACVGGLARQPGVEIGPEGGRTVVGRLAPGLGPEVDGHRLGLGQHHRLAARHPPLDRHLVGPVGHQVVEDAAVDHPAVHVLRPGKRPPF